MLPPSRRWGGRVWAREPSDRRRGKAGGVAERRAKDRGRVQKRVLKLLWENMKVTPEGKQLILRPSLNKDVFKMFMGL